MRVLATLNIQLGLLAFGPQLQKGILGLAEVRRPLPTPARGP